MYALASQITDLPIVSLQTGETIAWTKTPIIDLADLEILAFACQSHQSRNPLVLLTRDIRQLASDCIIIDGEDELTDPKDIVRLKKALHANYSPIDKPVVTETGRRLGRVEDYSVNLQTARVQKLHIKPSLLRYFFDASLIADRSQILDVTPKQITVREALSKTPLFGTDPLPDTPS